MTYNKAFKGETIRKYRIKGKMIAEKCNKCNRPTGDVMSNKICYGCNMLMLDRINWM